MTKLGLVHGSTSSAAARDPVNDDGLRVPLPVGVVPRRNTPANDNPAIHDLPTCLPVTDEEVTLLHRYLSREILGLFS
jgi:hypothetical protein